MISKPKTPRSWRCSVCQARHSTIVRTCPVCWTRRGTKRSSVGSRCDKLWADYIKRPGKCFVCGVTEGLEAAHIIGRAQRVVRWSVNPPNGICLCHKDHRAFDTYKVDRFSLILRAIGATNYQNLQLKAQGNWDKDYDKVLRELKAL